MILPQKFSKSLGENKLKIGISVKELFICSIIPNVLNFFNIEAFICFISFLGVIGILALKNNFLEPGFIKNSIEKKQLIEWDRVEIND